MKIFPAIDLYEGKAVRLYRGNYDEMTVYSEKPYEIAEDFAKNGASYLHLVDLEGAKSGETPNLETIRKIREKTNLFIEVGGGIRSLSVIEKYLSIGIDRVILGTSAVENNELLLAAIEKYGDKIAVGVDIRDGNVAIKGWTQRSEINAMEFCRYLDKIGVKTVICTDISKDGAMMGTNRELYREMSGELGLDIIASGGVSSLDDIIALKSLGLYGAIIGKAYYTGAIRIKEAIELSV